MAEFLPALAYTLNNEGEYSNDPDDKGGPTYKGLTLRTAKKYGINNVLTAKPDDISKIFKGEYWRFDGIKDQDVATKIFDMAVNFGLPTAIRLVQRSLIILKKSTNVRVDGIYGPETERVINLVNPNTMIDYLTDASIWKYREIVNKHPTQMKFLNGWMNRAKRRPGVKYAN